MVKLTWYTIVAILLLAIIMEAIFVSRIALILLIFLLLLIKEIKESKK